MRDLEEILLLIGAKQILCLGDVMLDEFVYGDVSRISPEAPTPVIQCKHVERMIGGAGNVARNLSSLGVPCVFVGLVGIDEAGQELGRALTAHPLISAHLVAAHSRRTTRKIRFVSEHHSTHLLRADWEAPAAADPASEAKLIEAIQAAMPRVGAVILSDYAKGTLSPTVIRQTITIAQIAGKPVVVDPKGRDFRVYSGATVITPNRNELRQATNSDLETDRDVANAAEELRSSIGVSAVLVTRSEEGMTLAAGSAPIHVPAHPVRVRDVSGAGDTVAAVLAAAIASGADLEAAMRLANAAASVVVGKPGTASLTLPELRSRILPSASLAAEEKIVFDWDGIERHVADWRRQRLRIGFTNGCFDIMHPGHVRLLAGARAACDRLIVGLNSDASVSRLKGADRPIQPASARAEVLAALEAVDLVVVFEEDTPLRLIEKLRPTVLVKGGDYSRENVVGREIVEAEGGEVILIDFVPGFSTTSIIKRSATSGIGVLVK